MAKVIQASYAAKLKALILKAAITGKLTGGTSGWEMVKLGEVCDYGKCTSIQSSEIEDNVWSLDLEDIEKDSGKLLLRVRFGERRAKGTRHVFKKGQLLYSKLRTYLNKVLVADEDGVCTTEIIPLDFGGKVLPDYARIVLMSQMVLDYTATCCYGVKMPRLGTHDGRNIPFPLPPLTIQKEIVGKVEELMPLVEEYGRAEEARLKLDAEFPEKFRKSILDLAIHGTLAAQDPSEPPAAIDSSVTTPPYPIPPNWKWVKLGEVCELISGVSYKKNDITNSGIRILRGGNLKEDHNIYFYDDDVFLPTRYASEENTLRKKDIVVVNSTGSATVIGRPAIVKEDCPNTQIGAFLRIVRVRQIEIADWVAIIFCSSFYKRHIQEVSKGTSIKNLKSEYFLDFAIPLPPLGEQKRIVGKVEAMMKVLESLNAGV